MTTVQEIMTKSVEAIGPTATLVDAAQKMRSFDVGALPVVKDGSIEGMITDRDITIRAVAEGLNPKVTKVSEVMTPSAVTVNEDKDVKEAAKLMEKHQIRRLVVTDSSGKPSGFLAQADLALREADEHLTSEVVHEVSKH